MKAYIASRDWADEGDVFFFSVISDEDFKAMSELIEIYIELDMLEGETDIYWGTNEFFSFSDGDYLDFIDKAVNITEKEFAVFKKFGITGFDIYDKILDILEHILLNYNCITKRYTIPEHLTQEDLNRIQPMFVKLFGQADWNMVQKIFDEMVTSF